jgi:hypothetical protein
MYEVTKIAYYIIFVMQHYTWNIVIKGHAKYGMKTCHLQWSIGVFLCVTFVTTKSRLLNCDYLIGLSDVAGKYRCKSWISGKNFVVVDTSYVRAVTWVNGWSLIFDRGAGNFFLSHHVPKALWVLEALTPAAVADGACSWQSTSILMQTFEMSRRRAPMCRFIIHNASQHGEIFVFPFCENACWKFKFVLSNLFYTENNAGI